MKKIAFLSILLLIMLIFSSYTVNKTIKIKHSPEMSSIKFEYFYRGFATIQEKYMSKYPNGTFVILTEKDWGEFMGKYVPGIPYMIPIDFSKEGLVFNSLFPARPIYSDGTDIKRFIVDKKKLEPVYLEHRGIGISNGIYAQNVDGIIHVFVNIVKINKKDIPKYIVNIYHKK